MRLTRGDRVRAYVWLSGISQNPSLPSPTLPLPSPCPSFCLSRGLHEWIGALSLSHDSKEHYWRWMLLKKEIDDGYEAGHVIHHFEYYLDWPCKAVTWAGLREREREQERAQSRTWASSDGWAKLLHCSFPDTRGAALLCSLIHPLAARFCAWKGKIKEGWRRLRTKLKVFLFVITVAL